MSRTILIVAALAALLLSAGPLSADPPTGCKAFYRDGQTFLTFTEDGSTSGERYRVYRYTKPITSATLADAERIAEIREGSSRFQEMWTTDGKGLLTNSRRPGPLPHIIPRLAIQPTDAGQAELLAEGAGLLVWTVQEKERESYYAVTTVVEGKEDRTVGAGNTAGPVREHQAPIGAVRYCVENGKDGKPYRDWYIMWMDYALWNPDYIGYAFPFAITRAAFTQGGPMPRAHLDGIGTMNVFTAGYTNYGCGDFSRNALPTWYFGYGTKVADRAGGIDVKQPVANYVQYRIMQTVLWARRHYRISDPRFVIWGNSMGASGAIGFALAFPKFVTAIWSNEGLTDYAHTVKKMRGQDIVMWRSSIWGNYGDPKLANPAKLLAFNDPRLDWYLKYDGMNVYDFRNAAGFLAKNVAEDFPLMIIGHCHQDGSIPADSQAYPFEQYIKDSRHCFSYSVSRGGHGWGSPIKGCPMESLVRWDESRPGFSGVPPIVAWKYPRPQDKDPSSRTYMLRVAWGVKAKPIGGKAIVETEDTWSIPLIDTSKPGFGPDYFVDLTPRNLQKMKVKRGQAFTFRITDLAGQPVAPNFDDYANGKDVQAAFKAEGRITADEHNLLLIPHVPICKAGCIAEVRRVAGGK